MGACWGDTEPVVVTLAQGDALEVRAGRCAWSLPGPAAEVTVVSPESTARLDETGEGLLAASRVRWWLLALLVLASVASRLALARTAWIGVDVAAVLTVLAASAVTPLWVLAWALKGLAGAALGAWLVARAAWSSRRWRWALGGGLGVVLAAFITVDPRWVVELNTAFNHLWANKDAPGRTGNARASTTPGPDATHLVVGYSAVNGSGLGTGAYGQGALDRHLQRTCGGDGTSFARHALDGANLCFMAGTWNQVAATLPRLTRRVFYGGFNDDLTAPVGRVGVWLATVLSVLPSSNPAPRYNLAWERGARANLVDGRRDELLACLERLAAGHPAPLTYVYDVGTFDLGHARRFGRDRWVVEKRRVVEAAGGNLVDLKSLLPGESPVYFNDVTHLSEVGYQEVARNLCARLR
jgi:hypothetical protein